MSARIPHEYKQKNFGSRGYKTMIFPRKTTLAAAVSAALLSGTAAQAQIGCSDIPGNQASAFIAGPTNPNNGFAEFVTDENNLALELCLDAANCFFDPVIPEFLFSEQIGFGAEAFWWLAEALVDTTNNGGIRAIVTMAAEAAFLLEDPVDGDQFPFTRLRIRLDVPATGVYTVTHPYGTETFVVDALIAGEEVRTSFDIGFANNTQNQGCVGPWLQWDAGAPAGFIGDGTTPHAVIGSPTGTNSLTISAVDLNGNAIGIDGQGNSVVSTNLFTVTGKLYDGTPATPMISRRSSYERNSDASIAQLDVFAKATNLANVAFDDGIEVTQMISGAGDSRSSDAESADFQASKVLEAPASVPATVAINATAGGTDATRLLRRVTDVVNITQAEYDAATSMLTIRAESSDASITPVLTTAEYPNETLPLTMFTLAPPATINVISEHGGSDESQVLVVDSTFPTANDDVAETDEDSAVLIDVKANDTSILSSTIGIVGPPTLGSAVVVADSIEYTPLPNWNGATTLAYRLTNSEGIISNTAIVTITVNPVNDDPVAVDDLAATDFETPIDIAVLANDTDIDGDTLSIGSVDPVSTLGGTLSIDGSLVSYTPPTGVSGDDTFTYTVSDGAGGTDTAQVTVTVTPAGNEPPTAAADSATVDEDSGASLIDVLANDTDPENDALTIIDVVPPVTGGTAITDGSIVTFTPSADFNGSTSFTYTIDDGNGNIAEGAVNVTVNPVNDDPVAVDDLAATDSATPIDIAVLANDTDIDGDTLSIGSVDPVSTLGGTLSINGSLVSYTPATGVSGDDTFTYTVSDGAGGTDTAQVTVTVTLAGNEPPTAVADSATVDEDSGANPINVLANDTDPENNALTIVAVVSPVTGGTATTDGSIVSFTPSADFNGSTSFTYTIDDGNGNTAEGAVNVTVNPVNDPPVAADDSATTDAGVAILIPVLGNDTDIDGDGLSIGSVDSLSALGGTVSINGSLVSYTPPTDIEGVDTFSYTASDGLLTDTATVTVNVNRPPQPVAFDVDIRSISGQNGRLGRAGTASVSTTIRLTLVTPPAGLEPLAITLVGQHSNGEPEYRNTRTIVIDPAVTNYTLNSRDFPAYTTTAAGTITWTVSFDDADADIDVASAISTIR